MPLDPGSIREMRLLILPYRNHTVCTLTTRDGHNREDWNRREHTWDLPLPQGDYATYSTEDQFWMVLAALAASTMPARSVAWAEPPEPPDGGYRGEVLPLFSAPQGA